MVWANLCVSKFVSHEYLSWGFSSATIWSSVWWDNVCFCERVRLDKWNMIMAQNGKTREKNSKVPSESFEVMMGTSPSYRPISHSN